MIKCPDCSHENADATVICEACGRLLTQPTITTKKYDNADYQKGVPRWGSARFKNQMNLIISVVDSNHSFVFNYDEIDEIILGRKSPKDTNPAYLDLSTVGGLDKGVSRVHAKIQAEHGSLLLVDNESANGTYLNGQKLFADQPRVIRDGDEIRLSHLTVRITFAPIE
ncbi:MAG: FHA domain-containing protein [Phototrophicaceae bacterium]